MSKAIIISNAKNPIIRRIDAASILGTNTSPHYLEMWCACDDCDTPTKYIVTEGFNSKFLSIINELLNEDCVSSLVVLGFEIEFKYVSADCFETTESFSKCRDLADAMSKCISESKFFKRA